MHSAHVKRKDTRFRFMDYVASMDATREEKAVLWPLAYHANDAGEARPGETTLCRESGIHEPRTLRRWLRKLEGKGWITTRLNAYPVQIGGRTLYLNVYTLTLPREDTIVSAHDGDGRTNDTPREDAEGTTGGQIGGGRADTAMSDKAQGNPVKHIKKRNSFF